MPRSTDSVTLTLPAEEDTAALGATLARLLGPGDTLLLYGPIGAGKTHLARALIRAKLGRSEDVPSPTFTLVQTYNAPDTEIWHADLYRLTHPDEVFELGLDAAFATALCLVEWPERLGNPLPPHAIALSLATSGTGRTATIHAPDRPGLLQAIGAAHG